MQRDPGSWNMRTNGKLVAGYRVKVSENLFYYLIYRRCQMEDDVLLLLFSKIEELLMIDCHEHILSEEK